MEKGNKIDMFFDIQSNSQFNIRNSLWSREQILEKLQEKISEKWALIFIGRDFGESAAQFFHEFYGIPAGKFEITQSYIKENPDVYLTTNDYNKYGAGIVNGINEFHKNKK